MYQLIFDDCKLCFSSFPFTYFCFKITAHSVSRWAFYGFFTFVGQPFFFFSLCALILTTSFWNARSSMKCLRMGFKLNPHWRMLCFEDLFWGNYFFVISSCSSFGEASIGFHGTQWLEIDPFILNSTVQNRVLPKPWTVLYAIYYFFLISDFSFCILFHITDATPSPMFSAYSFTTWGAVLESKSLSILC